MDCSLPGSSTHGISQARILEWVTIPFSRGSSRPRDQTRASRTAGRFFTTWVTRESPGPHRKSNILNLSFGWEHSKELQSRNKELFNSIHLQGAYNLIDTYNILSDKWQDEEKRGGFPSENQSRAGLPTEAVYRWTAIPRNWAPLNKGFCLAKSPA